MSHTGQPEPARSTDSKQVPLEDLLAAIALKVEDRESAVSALTVLSQQWRVGFEKIAAQKTFDGLNRYVGREAVFSEILVQIWDKADQFDSRGLTGLDVERLFYRWISTVAYHAIVDIVKKEHPVSLAELSDDEEYKSGVSETYTINIYSIPEPGSEEEAVELSLFAEMDRGVVFAIECIRSLSDKYKETLRRSAPFLKVGKREVEFPRESSHRQGIIADLKTTVDGFKALRSRAFRKIEKCLEIKNKLNKGTDE